MDGTARACMWCPAFTGLGAPHWDMYARGCHCGADPWDAAGSHIIRAALESDRLSDASDVLEAMEADTGVPMQELEGGRRSEPATGLLMQFQADIAGRDGYAVR